MKIYLLILPMICNLSIHAEDDQALEDRLYRAIVELRSDDFDLREKAGAELQRGGEGTLKFVMNVRERSEDTAEQTALDGIVSIHLHSMARAAWEQRRSADPSTARRFRKLGEKYGRLPVFAKDIFWTEMRKIVTEDFGRRMPADWQDQNFLVRVGRMPAVLETKLVLKGDGGGSFQRIIHTKILRKVVDNNVKTFPAEPAAVEDKKDAPDEKKTEDWPAMYTPEDLNGTVFKTLRNDKEVLDYIIEFQSLEQLTKALATTGEPFVYQFKTAELPGGELFVHVGRAWPDWGMLGFEFLFLDGVRENLTIATQNPILRSSSPKSSDKECSWDVPLYDLLSPYSVCLEVGTKQVAKREHPKSAPKTSAKRERVVEFDYIYDPKTRERTETPCSRKDYPLLSLRFDDAERRREGAFALGEDAVWHLKSAEPKIRVARQSQVVTALVRALEAEDDLGCAVMMNAALNRWTGKEHYYWELDKWREVLKEMEAAATDETKGTLP